MYFSCDEHIVCIHQREVPTAFAFINDYQATHGIYYQWDYRVIYDGTRNLGDMMAEFAFADLDFATVFKLRFG